MNGESGPFDPGAEDDATHLVLENARGQLSLWPVWREVPPGWSARPGPPPTGPAPASGSRAAEGRPGH
ncbi:MbtH family NRPS accessory protein [Streptomyces sp. B1I3]|uniref:MbtH family NRPS accessory protein n=1 Tax=Streptomyces sp. B1I3 TaxID=3042264 RepID=UPI00277FD7F2|nr:MbtH family NRPS accessory protein [Streptomyces sp. B1I3]MDQ0792602.1 MbtH protein [Streptomyces sp. B1I3]